MLLKKDRVRSENLLTPRKSEALSQYEEAT